MVSSLATVHHCDFHALLAELKPRDDVHLKLLRLDFQTGYFSFLNCFSSA